MPLGKIILMNFLSALGKYEQVNGIFIKKLPTFMQQQ